VHGSLHYRVREREGQAAEPVLQLSESEFALEAMALLAVADALGDDLRDIEITLPGLDAVYASLTGGRAQQDAA